MLRDFFGTTIAFQKSPKYFYGLETVFLLRTTA
jgi:hypothetical protein